MRKTFPMEAPNLKPARVVDSIKNEVRKYLKRERRKVLPEGVDFWDFACRTGRDRESAAVTHVAEINAAIDTAAGEQWPEIYLEILATPGHRTPRNPPSQRPESMTKVDPRSE